jgi:hypothetical protein
VKLSTLTLKFLPVLLAVATVVVFLSPSGIRAGTIKTEVIYDQTAVYPWYGTSRNTSSPYNHWMDIIANDPTNWDIKRVEVSWLFTTPDDASETITMKIYTNYPLYGGEADTADVWLKNNVTGDVAGILLHDHSDRLVSGIDWSSSRTNTVPNTWSNGAWIYAGEYAPQGTNPQPGAVPWNYIQSFSVTVGAVTVSQGLNPDQQDCTYITTMVFPLTFLGSEWIDFDFTVMSGTCANEVLAGTADPVRPAPLPASALLLVSGLVGLGLLGLRRQRS